MTRNRLSDSLCSALIIGFIGLSLRLGVRVGRAANGVGLTLRLRESGLLRAPLDFDRRRKARVFQLKLAALLFKLRGLPPQLLVLVTDRDGLEVLARADDEAARQQRPGKRNDRQPDEYAPADRPCDLRVANLFVGVEAIGHNICLKG